MRTRVVYAGSRAPDAAGPAEVVRIDPDGQVVPIAWRTDLVNHSPTGLNWGYGGSGPAQCALAMLADFLDGNDQAAVRLHQDFKFRFVAGFDDAWTLSGDEIRQWINGEGKYRHEDKFRPQRIKSVVPCDGGFEVTFDPCGHAVWCAVEPCPAGMYCGECVDEVVEAVRRERQSQ